MQTKNKDRKARLAIAIFEEKDQLLAAVDCLADGGLFYNDMVVICDRVKLQSSLYSLYHSRLKYPGFSYIPWLMNRRFPTAHGPGDRPEAGEGLRSSFISVVGRSLSLQQLEEINPHFDAGRCALVILISDQRKERMTFDCMLKYARASFQLHDLDLSS
jgi:hypothetical protein